jgi:histidinol-phosphate aminotransferase
MNGSNEVLTTLMQLFAQPRPGSSAARVLYFKPSFVLYGMSSARLRLDAVEVPLDASFQLDLPAIERALVEQRPNVAIFTYPNNPTGTLWSRDAILGFVERNRDIVFVADEAYIDFAGPDVSLIDVLPAHPNLIVTRTLSKAYGLAALRLGYLVASPAILKHFERARLIYNVGAVNEAAAVWLLTRHRDRILRHVDTIIAERARLTRELGAIPGFRVVPSHTNFVLVRVGQPGDRLATRAWQRLQQRGVLVRNFDGPPGPLSGCWRVSVGTPAENSLFLDELRTALAALV